MQQNLLQKYAVIVWLLILMAAVISMREWVWFTEITASKQQGNVDYLLQLEAPIRETTSNCIIMQKSIEYHIPITACAKAGVDRAQIGDRAEIVGSWKTSLTTIGKHQKSFIYVTKVKIIPIQPNPVISWVWWIREINKLHRQIVAVYQSSLPEPVASLVAGVVIGEQTNLPPAFEESLKFTGTMHIVVASGYNVIVVITAVSLVTVRIIGRRWGSVVSIAAVCFYVMLAGASPPVVRAGIMGIFMLLGVAVGRSYWPFYGLIVSLWLMLIVSPWLLVSVSFQLSAAATLGLMLLSPQTSQLILPKQKQNNILAVLKESFISTCAASIATVPIQLISFGSASFLGLLVNPLVLWLIPPLMMLGSIQAIMGIVWANLASYVSWLIYPIGNLFISLIIMFEKIPFGYYSLTINWWHAIGWWCMWLGLIRLRRCSQVSA